MYKHIIITIATLIPLQTLAAEHPTAFELLDKYAQTQDKLQSSFILKSQNTSIVNGHMMEGRHKANKLRVDRFVELRFDGERISFRLNMWQNGSITGDFPKDKSTSSYISNLWDGKYFSSYARDSRTPENDLGTVDIQKGDPLSSKKDIISIGYNGHEVLGIFFGDYERIDTVLRQADTITVQAETERIGDSNCYVIEAVAKNRGKYTVWIDPQHGYNIAKATVKKGENSILYGEAPGQIKVNVFNSLNNVHFKKINDNIWVPEQADIVLNRRWANGDFADIKQHNKLIEITLNPNHDALGSFVPDDIKNGAKVYIFPAIDVYYRWQNGKVVDEKGSVILDFRPKKPTK